MPDRFNECFYIIAHLDLLAEKWIGPVKLGISRNPTSRVAQLQSGNPHRIGLYWQWPTLGRRMSADIERLAHEHFKGTRLAGEWFDVHPDEALLWAKGFNRQCLMILAHDILERGEALPADAQEAICQILAEAENA